MIANAPITKHTDSIQMLLPAKAQAARKGSGEGFALALSERSVGVSAGSVGEAVAASISEQERSDDAPDAPNSRDPERKTDGPSTPTGEGRSTHGTGSERAAGEAGDADSEEPRGDGGEERLGTGNREERERAGEGGDLFWGMGSVADVESIIESAEAGAGERWWGSGSEPAAGSGAEGTSGESRRTVDGQAHREIEHDGVITRPSSEASERFARTRIGGGDGTGTQAADLTDRHAARPDAEHESLRMRRVRGETDGSTALGGVEKRPNGNGSLQSVSVQGVDFAQSGVQPRADGAETTGRAASATEDVFRRSDAQTRPGGASGMAENPESSADPQRFPPDNGASPTQSKPGSDGGTSSSPISRDAEAQLKPLTAGTLARVLLLGDEATRLAAMSWPGRLTPRSDQLWLSDAAAYRVAGDRTLGDGAVAQPPGGSIPGAMDRAAGVASSSAHHAEQPATAAGRVHAGEVERAVSDVPVDHQQRGSSAARINAGTSFETSGREAAVASSARAFPTTPSSPGVSSTSGASQIGVIKEAASARVVHTGGSGGAQPEAGQAGQPKRPAEAQRAAFEAQVSRSLASAMASRHGQVTIRLQPEHLGRMTVRVNIREGAVRASFEVTGREAQRLLSESMESLRGSLEQRGLTVEKLDVQRTERESDPGGGAFDAERRGGEGSRDGARGDRDGGAGEENRDHRRPDATASRAEREGPEHTGGGVVDGRLNTVG